MKKDNSSSSLCLFFKHRKGVVDPIEVGWVRGEDEAGEAQLTIVSVLAL